MLSLHAGYDVGYLTDAVGGGGADYYLSAAGAGGEPPGFWAGRGAADLGLSGEVDPGTMRALYHRSVGPGGPLNCPQGKASYGTGRGQLADRIEEAVAARVAELGPFPTAEEIDEIRLRERAKVRNSVPFFDFTFSATKSVSVAHAGYLAAAAKARQDGQDEAAAEYERRAEAIIEAMRETARAVVGRIERTAAYTRTGHHSAGTGEWRDAKGVTAAVFVQRTSREGDPQLHAHIAVLNKVQRADGADDRHRTLDSRSLHRERLGIAAVADRVLAQKLAAQGLRMVQRPDGNGLEVGGVTEATMAAFSSRRTTITPEIARLAREYEAVHGHAPSRRALWSLRQWATLQTRKGKSETVRTPAEELAAWTEQASREEAQALADVHGAIAEFGAVHGPAAPLSGEERERVCRVAVAEVQRQNATWTASQLLWELHRALPALPAGTDPVGLLEELLTETLGGRVDGTDIVVLAPAPDPFDVSVLGVRASDGESVYRAPGRARYCTAEQLDTEEWLLRSAIWPVRQAVTPAEAEAALAASDLDRTQRAVAEGLLTAERAISVFVAPAGTGKTHTIAAFARAWTTVTGRRVIGLSTSENAARVMAGEGLAESYNIARFLGKIKDSDQTHRTVPVHRDDVLVIDEASQVSTEDLARIQVIAAQAGARVILTGDTAQLASPENGGMMRLIARDHGYWKLHEVRRFAEEWERRASLRLREGDIRAIGSYKMRGRIQGGPENMAHAQAVRMWAADFTAGKDTLLLAGSNEEAAQLARLARELLAEWGRAPRETQITLSDGNEAGTGDLVRARLNVKIDAGGQALTNRDTLRITGWQGSGDSRAAIAVRQTGPGQWSRPFLVPAAYLQESAELAYAGNVHVAQGRTVDTGHLVVSATIGRESLYVGMTRGREANTAHVVTGRPEAGKVAGPGDPDPAAELAAVYRAVGFDVDTPGADHDPRPEMAAARAIVAAKRAEPQPRMEQAPAEAVLAAAMSNDTAGLTATEVIREDQAATTNARYLLNIWSALTRGESFRAADAAVKARLSERDFQRYMAEPQRHAVRQQLRAAELAGHDVGEILDRVTARPMQGAHSIAAVLHGRVAKLGLPQNPRAVPWARRVPDITEPQRQEATRAAAAGLDARQRELGTLAAIQPPAWAVRYLGPPPTEPGALRDDWIARAGTAALYREAAGHTDPEQAVGPAPAGNPELRQAYLAAMTALEMQTEEAAVRAAPQRDLEAKVRGYARAAGWAPPRVAADLDATAAAHKHTTGQAEQAREVGDEQARRGAEALAEYLAERRAALAEVQAARDEWSAATGREHQEAKAAAAELARRGVDPEPLEPDEPGPGEADGALRPAETGTGPAGPSLVEEFRGWGLIPPEAGTEAGADGGQAAAAEPGTAPEAPSPATELDRQVEAARAAMARLAAERAAAAEAEDDLTVRELHAAEAEALQAQPWQAGETRRDEADVAGPATEAAAEAEAEV